MLELSKVSSAIRSLFILELRQGISKQARMYDGHAFVAGIEQLCDRRCHAQHVG